MHDALAPASRVPFGVSLVRGGRRLGALLLLPAVLAACDDDPTGPEDDPEGLPELTVDASEAWAWVRLGDPAEVVQVNDPAASASWHLGFFATSVSLNGGDAGPGDVEAFCLCQNEDLSDAEVAALTDEDGLADFEAVTTSDVPADDEAWESDTLVPAVNGWYSYDFMTHQLSANPARVFKVRAADGVHFAKVHVTAIDGATQAHPGTVTFELAVQEAAGEAFGDTETIEVDASGGPVAIDLETASVVDVGTEGWDLEIDGYTIRVNGGVSGDADAGAIWDDETAFADIADAGDMDDLYKVDAFGGVFASEEAGRQWYRYNLQGNHQIWPTYNVYLVRTGEDVYKVQLTSYYDADSGDSRHITFRYERLEP